MNPRTSLRKILGVYEHELNDWLEAALRRVSRVVDVGANDGYFTFGCAAAFRRLGKVGEIIAFEPQGQHFVALQQAVESAPSFNAQINLVQSFVGREVKEGTTTLDALCRNSNEPRAATLIKIDVEGAEDQVLAGAESWLNSKNVFLIEVHTQDLFDSINRLFVDKGLELECVRQSPLSFIGGEVRDKENCWLVSRLDSLK